MGYSKSYSKREVYTDIGSPKQTIVRLYFWGAPKSLQMVTTAIKCQKTLTSWKESYEQPRQHIKSRDVTLSTKVHLVKAMVFSVVMYGCESWTVKKAER